MSKEIDHVLQLVAAASTIEDAEVTPETDLFAAGVVDSLSFVALVTQVEDHFGIRFEADLLIPENFNTPTAIARTVMQARHEGVRNRD